MRSSKLLTVILALLAAVALLAGSIAAPILCRPFYYAHIDAMALPERTGWSRDEIVTAYNEMLDYCLGGEEFSTGVLKWSEEGKSHFHDVRGLFLLDLWAGGIALVLLAAVLIAMRMGAWRPRRLWGRGPAFWAGCGLLTAGALVGGLAAANFDRAFVVFHAIFFPGKDNWIFDPYADQIINVLPQDFFMHCAILILALVVLGCVILMAADLASGRKTTK